MAASVILLRPSDGGFETFMLRRSGRSHFAPDAFVFPGGTIDPQDTSDAMRTRTQGLDDARLAEEFRATTPASLPHDVAPIVEGDAAALKIAALRELFEEAGVLLALGATGDAAGDRASVAAGEVSFAAFLAGRELFADLDALTLFSHWVTPPSEPRRYNTHFFLARAPDQAAAADANETHDGIWISPGQALAKSRAGEFYLVYPTIKHLERLQAFDSIDALMEYSRTKPILTIVPTGTIADGFAMPAELERTW